jgi:hypothetical protein
MHVLHDRYIQPWKPHRHFVLVPDHQTCGFHIHYYSDKTLVYATTYIRRF